MISLKKTNVEQILEKQKLMASNNRAHSMNLICCLAQQSPSHLSATLSGEKFKTTFDTTHTRTNSMIIINISNYAYIAHTQGEQTSIISYFT